MARTIGLAVGMVLLAAGIGGGLAYVLVGTVKQQGGHKLWCGACGGPGGGGRYPPAVDRWDPEPGGGGVGGGVGIGGAAAARSAGQFVMGGLGGGGGAAALASQLPRQPSLEQQLQAQQQRHAAAAAGVGGVSAGLQQQVQPRVHHWRPVAPNRARESPFASLLEDDGGGLQHAPAAVRARPGQQQGVGVGVGQQPGQQAGRR